MGSQEPFGQLLRRYRREAELTQEALAERAGLSVRAVRDIEAGSKHRPRRDTVELLLDALAVPVAEQPGFRAAAQLAEPEETRPPPADGAHAALPVGRFLGSLPTGTLVARDGELKATLQAVERAVVGEGRLVLLSGEPGVGKTRLAQEVTLALTGHGALIGAGRCYEPEQSVPYFAFLDALTALLRAAPGVLRDEIPRRWPLLSRLLPDEVDPSAPPDSGGHDEEMLLFRAVTGFLEALSRTAPVTILLDDLHWADTSTLKLLLHVARHTRTAPIFLLGTYRDVEVGRQHPLEGALRDLDREGLVERVYLRRLNQRDTGSLIAELMGEPEVSEEFTALVHERTEGNPFFVQQVLRVMVERGDVFRRDGRWDRKSVAEIEVPESIRSVVGQRLSRLPEEAQDALRVASVFGQRFQFDDLLAITVLSERDQETYLERAASAGLVQTADGDTYAFDHALTQQTLYAELPVRRRRRMHVAAAAAIEQSPKTRDAELAWHFLRAGDARRALPHAMQAGDAAMEVIAWSEAEMHYRTAAQLAHELGDAGQEALAWRKLGDLLLAICRYDESIEALDQAAEAYGRVGEVEGEVQAVFQLMYVHYFRGALTEASSRARRVVEKYPGVSSPLLSFVAACADGLDAFREQRFPELLSFWEQAIEAASRLDNTQLLAFALMWRGASTRLNGQIEDAFRNLEESLALADSLNDPLIQGYAGNMLAEACLFNGRWTTAVTALDRALVAVERMGNDEWSAYERAHIGWALTALGEWDRARQYLEEAVRMARSMGQSWFAAHPRFRLASLCIQEGKWDDASRLLDEAAPIAEAIDDRQWVYMLNDRRAELDVLQGNPRQAVNRLAEHARALDSAEAALGLQAVPPASLAHAYLDLGDAEHAAKAIHTGLQYAESSGQPPLRAEWLRLQGVLLAKQGRLVEAERIFAEAHEVARSLSMPYEEARALYEWGAMLQRAGQPERARVNIAEALQNFKRLGAQHDIEQAEEALAAATQNS